VDGVALRIAKTDFSDARAVARITRELQEHVPSRFTRA
jgi:hypothetical protein